MSRSRDWAPDNGLAFHNWWHLALFHLDRGDIERVLDLYDTAFGAPDTNVVLEMVDASALLWRLHLRGVELDDRWRALADAWEPRVGEGLLRIQRRARHDGLRRRAGGAQRLASLLQGPGARRTAAGGTNGRMTWEVGLPLCRALHAFGEGDYADAVELLLPLRLVAHRFGGSHAQRDLINLTLIEAALRGRRLTLARALLAERTALKPASPFNWATTCSRTDAARRRAWRRRGGETVCGARRDCTGWQCQLASAA